MALALAPRGVCRTDVKLGKTKPYWFLTFLTETASLSIVFVSLSYRFVRVLYSYGWTYVHNTYVRSTRAEFGVRNAEWTATAHFYAGRDCQNGSYGPRTTTGHPQMPQMATDGKFAGRQCLRPRLANLGKRKHATRPISEVEI